MYEVPSKNQQTNTSHKYDAKKNRSGDPIQALSMYTKIAYRISDIFTLKTEQKFEKMHKNEQKLTICSYFYCIFERKGVVLFLNLCYSTCIETTMLHKSKGC